MLNATAVTVSGEDRDILMLDSLALEAGQFCAVIGPNGAGKSTLLQTLAGNLMTPSCGKITWLNVPLTQWRAADLALSRSWLPQSVELAWEYRVCEVLGLACWQLAAAERDQVLHCIRQQWELDFCWERPCNALSGGEQRRVHLARSVAQVWLRVQRGEPALLLLDEPIAHLDPAGELWALHKLRDLAQKGATLLCVLHDINLAARYADHLLAMRAGQVLAQGAPRQVLTEELLGNLYDVPFMRLQSGQQGLPWFVPEGSGAGKAAP